MPCPIQVAIDIKRARVVVRQARAAQAEKDRMAEATGDMI